MSGPTASKHLDVCGAVEATCMGNDIKDKHIFNAELLQLHARRRRDLHPASYKAAAMQKEHYKGEEHNEVPRDPLGGSPFLRPPHHSPDQSFAAALDTSDRLSHLSD
jgi:hypothetical protein